MSDRIKTPFPLRKWGLDVSCKNKMRKKQAVNKMSAKMPLVDGIFFKIHGSKLKPDPSEITGQAAKICKSHRVFFFGVSEDMLDHFLAMFIKFAQGRCVAAAFTGSGGVL